MTKHKDNVNLVRNQGNLTSSCRPNSGGSKITSQIQWLVSSINAELVVVFLGE